MIILFLLFLLQFSLACACLAINEEQQEQFAENGWRIASNETKETVQYKFDCCGFKEWNVPGEDPSGHPPCGGVSRDNKCIFLHIFGTFYIKYLENCI